MPGSWSRGTEWRALGTGICSSLLQLNLSLLSFALICLPGQETQSFLHGISYTDLQPRWLEAYGTKGEEWFRPTLRSLWTSGLQENFSTTAMYCSHPLHPPHCQDAKKIRRDFFFLDCQDHIILNISCLLMAILEFTPQAMSHFLLHLRLLVGDEELDS